VRRLDRDLLQYARNLQTFAAQHRRGHEGRYSSVMDIILKEGGIFSTEPYTKAEEGEILKALGRSGCEFLVKRCFYNAQELAMSGGLGYAEGNVVNGDLPVPIEHAWNTLPSGKVVDLTIRPLGQPETADPKKLLARAKRNLRNGYIGIRFPVEEIQKSWLRNKHSRMLLEDPKVIELLFEKGYPAAWKGAVLSGPRPEEEWLDQPEHEGQPPSEKRSPHEGDIPPWAQRGYAGIFPMNRKVFYITAYVGLGPGRAGRAAKVPVLGNAYPIQDVGTAPRGVPFGSEFMYHRFAAIPVRNEDVDDAGVVIDYLEALIGELGAYGKILMEEQFPDGATVKLQRGRWFPVDQVEREYGGVKFVNAYTVNRIYGGPEEGGWWFDEGYPVASVPIREEDAAAQLEWEEYLKTKVSWASPHDKYSVLGHDVYEVGIEDHFARHYPETPPQYR